MGDTYISARTGFIPQITVISKLVANYQTDTHTINSKLLGARVQKSQECHKKDISGMYPKILRTVS